MNGIDPIVRNMILCADARRNPNNPNTFDLVGLLTTVRPPDGSTYPLPLPNLCAYLSLTGGRGTGVAQINLVHADTGRLVRSSVPVSLTFPASPLAVLALVVRLRNCVLPQPGPYWLEFCYNQRVIAQQPMLAT
jgi:hypothetical protein